MCCATSARAPARRALGLITLGLTSTPGRDGWPGGRLALPVPIKFYPALLLLAPRLERRPRALVGCAATSGALALVGLLGWGHTARGGPAPRPRRSERRRAQERQHEDARGDTIDPEHDEAVAGDVAQEPADT